MIYCDFGSRGTVIKTAFAFKKFPQYACYSYMTMMPAEAFFKASSIIVEDVDDNYIWWYKHNTLSKVKEPLDSDDMKQFMFQKLASTFIK